MKRRLSIFLLLIWAISSHAQSDSGKNPLLTGRFIIGAGWYAPKENVELGVAGSTDLENIENIDFDERLGLSGGKNTFNARFKWRFSGSKLWYVTGDYFAISNEKTFTLDEEIEWEDVTYAVGVEVEMGYRVGLYRIFFGRVISSGQQHEFSAGLGIHGLDTSAFIEGNGSVNEGSVSLERRENRIFIPLPNIGASYIWAPSTRWALSASIDWFGIEIDNISGGLWNLSPGISFMFTEKLGITANYQFLNFRAGIDQDDWNGNFRLDFGGPSVRLLGVF